MVKEKGVLRLLLVALVLRLLLVLVLDLKTGILATNFSAPSSGEQRTMAQGLLRDGDFTMDVVDGRSAPSAYQPPLYPLILAGVFAIVGESPSGFLVVQIAQCLVGVLTVLLTVALARRLLEDKHALIAGWLAALWPALVYMPNEAHPISLLIPVLLWITILTVDIWGQPEVKRFAWLGIAFGMGLLIRSELLAAFLIFAIIFGWRFRKQALPGLAVALAIGLGIQALWVFRNVRSLGKPVLTTTAGLNLFRGNGPTATGGSYEWSGQIVWETPATLEAKKSLHWSRDYETRLDAIYSQELKRSLAADPWRPLRLIPVKLAFYLTTDFTHPKGRNPIVWLPWLLLAPFIALGMRSLWKKPGAWPLYFWGGFYLLVVLALFALPRYRIGIEPMFLVFAAAGLSRQRAFLG